MSTVKTFEVGTKVLYVSLVCNYEVVWVYSVGRTKKFVTPQDDKGRVRRRGVYVYRNEECANPFGRLLNGTSTAADNISHDEVNPMTMTANEEEISENEHAVLTIPIR